MAKAKIELPSVLTKNSWFYELHKEKCELHLDKPYVSYSTINSWEDYREDMIKQKFAGIEIPGTVYTEFGSFIGEAVEHGKFGDNPNGFTGLENFQTFLDDRPANGEYERMILIDMGEYLIIGFIDIFSIMEDGRAMVVDLKSGGKKKEEQYMSDEYIQVPLYAAAIEQEGIEIGTTGVWFVRREKSHYTPPLHISEEQFFIELEYNDERKDYAMKKVDRVVREISDCYKTYKKIFGNVKIEI